MSVQCKVMFERGRFFIETGTAMSFNIFHTRNMGLIRYVPAFLLKRIEGFIISDNREAATALWFHACEVADGTPRLLHKVLICVGLNIAILVVSLGVLFYTLY